MHRITPKHRTHRPHANTGPTPMALIEAAIGLVLLAAIAVLIIIALCTPWLRALLVMAALFVLLCLIMRDGLELLLRLMSRL